MFLSFNSKKTASANNWNAEDKVAALSVALKEFTAEVLQTIPNWESSSYEALIGGIIVSPGSSKSS